VFIKNSVTDIETLIDNLMHCAWDSSSAFISSVPQEVNQRFITSNDFVVEEREKWLCLCDEIETQHCNNGKIGPYNPGQTLSFKFSFNDIICDASNIETRRGHSSYTCSNELKLLQLQSKECKSLEYTVKHNRNSCC